MTTQTLLVIAKVLPEPASSAAGTRLLQILELFREQGWEIKMASTAKPSLFSIDPTTLNIPFTEILLNDSSFDSFISELKPDAVLFDRFMTEEQFGWRVAEHCPNAIRILDTEDLHGLRSAREQALKEKRVFQTYDLFNTNAFREMASIWRCDLSLIISEFEMKLMREFFKVEESLLFYLPFLVSSEELKQSEKSPAYEERQHFVSIGNFLHGPNLDAVRYLHKNIWPWIRKQLPKAELHVYGAYVPNFILELHSESNGFLVKGRAENVNEVMRSARLLLAPLRFGAGLKGKLFDAMLNATPSITSNIGAEGMRGNLPWPGDIVDEEDEFVRKAIELYQNETAWKKASAACTKTLAQFKKEIFSGPFQSCIATMLQDLKKHRSNNFTGAILRQQQFNSSKFMALWIEAKNKTI